MDRINARYLESLEVPVDFVSVDVSFISLKLILPAVQKWLAPDAEIVALIKPQFEAGRDQVGKGGIVRDRSVHRQVLADLLAWAQQADLSPVGLTRSVIEGSDGNVEFLVWLRTKAVPMADMELAIELVTSEGDY
jgi:23S rRNA (cytidine1920-2'-O)/16S rRNA (cytidine1409-2'-O)-methyltransferase